MAARRSDVKAFSAACYFMVKQLRDSEKVPIGAIDDSWGGTPIRAWMSEAAVRAAGGAELADITDLYRKDPSAARRRFGESWGEWWRSRTGDKPGQEPWRASGRLQWKPVPSLDYWESWGPEWRSFDGAIWARKHVTLSARQAAQTAALSMSAIDDVDETFVNGTAVGGENAYNDPRKYALAKGILHAGDNEIMVYIRDFGGPGGFAGPQDAFKLTFADGTVGAALDRLGIFGDRQPRGQSAAGAAIERAGGRIDHLQCDDRAARPARADRCRLVPGRSGRRHTRLRTAPDRLMGDWRRQFGNPDLPFLIVGLAGFGKPVAAPHESGWAEVDQRSARGGAGRSRAQRSSARSTSGHGATSIRRTSRRSGGGWRSRLRRLPTAVAERSARCRSARRAPAMASSSRFTKPLQALSGSRPLGFELCGPASGSCRFADARVNGDTVEIAGDGQPVTRVRYAWADYPIVNLYDQDLLPAPVFELPVQ